MANEHKPACLTCGDSGWVGGPSFYNPGEGGEECPDCALTAPVATEQAQAVEGQWIAPTVEQVEHELGMGHGAWDMEDPEDIIRAVLRLTTSPAATPAAPGAATVSWDWLRGVINGLPNTKSGYSQLIARHDVFAWIDEGERRSLAALAQPAPVQAEAQQAVSLDSIEQYRMQMAGISTAAMGYWKEGESIHPDYDTLALRDVAKLYAKYDTLYKAADRLALIDWVAQRWHAEVANRPMVNVHRRSLDDTWRQILRHLGIDDRARLGPTHDDLRAEISTKEWEAMNGKAAPVQQDAPAPSMVGDAK